ncbi:MAG: flagellar hook basal-body protein [Phycisphaerales bacterium]
MNYGLQISASGALTSLYRQDVLSNNLANLETTGFKPDIPATMQRDAARIEDGLPYLPSDPLIERLGAGVLAAPNRVSFAQGPLDSTGRDLDMAIEGDGFFVLQDEHAQGGDRLRLTRDGRFQLDERGRLVSSTTGMPVLDRTNRPVVIRGEGRVGVALDGSLTQNGQAIARLQLVDVPDKSALKKLGANLFAPSANATASFGPIDGRVRQGVLEGSAVNEVAALMAVTSASRDVQANIGMITYHDRMMERAINTFARIA